MSPHGKLGVHNPAIPEKNDINNKLVAFNEISENIEMDENTHTKTADAMKTNWGGPKFSRKLVAQGDIQNTMKMIVSALLNDTDENQDMIE